MMSCITALRCHHMSTAHAHYCKQPHVTTDVLENGVRCDNIQLFPLKGAKSFV